MRGFIVGVLLTLVVIFGGLYFVVARGLFPVGADNPPGPYERKLANMAMDEYVGKHAPKQANPFQPTSANLMTGAMDYEEHCAMCHGGAKDRISPLRSKFNPPVPQLINHIPRDEDSHLWFVTKHGIRLTGMPSWEGVLSDDDIWKIIAFVKNSDKLPPDVQEMWMNTAKKQATSAEAPAPGQNQNAAPAAPGRK